MPKSSARTQETATISWKRPKSRENALNSRHFAAIIDLPIVPEVMPAFSGWPYQEGSSISVAAAARSTFHSSFRRSMDAFSERPVEARREPASALPRTGFISASSTQGSNTGTLIHHEHIVSLS